MDRPTGTSSNALGGKPANTKIVFVRQGNQRLGFFIPRTGFRCAGCFFMLFVLLWNFLVGIFILSESAKDALPFLAIFQIVGFIMLCIAVWFVFVKTFVAMDRETFLVRRDLFGIKWQRSCKLKDIQDIRLEQAYTQNNKPVYGVGVIPTTASPIVFGSTLSDAEKAWILREIKNFWLEATGKLQTGQRET